MLEKQVCTGTGNLQVLIHHTGHVLLMLVIFEEYPLVVLAGLQWRFGATTIDPVFVEGDLTRESVQTSFAVVSLSIPTLVTHYPLHGLGAGWCNYPPLISWYIYEHHFKVVRIPDFISHPNPLRFILAPNTLTNIFGFCLSNLTMWSNIIGNFIPSRLRASRRFG